jgi:hypothetical protein
MADPGDYDDGRYQHTVHAGERIWIGNARSWNPECQSTGGTFRITEPPAHGTLSQDKIMGTIPDGRDECSGRPAVLPRLFYTASRSYQGEDHVGYDVIFGNGGHKHIDENITVTAALIPIHPGQVFSSVPPSGTLKIVKAGTPVFIDDGSCPAGQIKRMVTGSDHPLIARQFSCVVRR